MLAVMQEALRSTPTTVEQRKHVWFPLVSTQDWSKTLPSHDAAFMSCVVEMAKHLLA